MPYNPQITDQSGILLAQGRVAGGMAALGGISQGIQTYQKNKLQNQVLSSENDSLIAGLQQLQQMGGGATMSNLAPAGMEKLIQKHLEGGGLNLTDSMKLNSMLNTTLKTAQVGQQMQAQQMQAQVAQQKLMNEIATGRQAQADVTGIGSILRELSGQELTPERFTAAAAKANLSPAAIDNLTQSLGRLQSKAPARPNVYDSPQAVLAEIARLKAENKIPEGVVPVVKAEGGGYVFETIGAPTPPPGVETTYEKLGAESAQKTLDSRKQTFADSIRAGKSGEIVLRSLDKGATTGVFDPFKTFAMRIASEVIPGYKPDVFEKELTQKGIAALTASGVTALARGLGSMSNADRDFFERVFPSFTDSTLLNRFYAEMVVQDKKFAEEDRAFIRELERKGVRQDEINRQLDERQEGRNVAETIYNKVRGSGLGKAQPASGGSGGATSNYNVGDQVKQGGKTYEWNGSNWFEVK